MEKLDPDIAQAIADALATYNDYIRERYEKKYRSVKRIRAAYKKWLACEETLKELLEKNNISRLDAMKMYRAKGN